MFDKIKNIFKSTKEEQIEAKKYFDMLKEKKRNLTCEELTNISNNIELMLEKALSVGQVKMAKKLYFYLVTIEKEKQLLDKGYDSYVLKSDIEEFIEKVENKVIKIIEISRYEREIPMEIIEKIAETKDIFSEFYIVFTDYTDKSLNETIKERKEKDPICFGVFRDKELGLANERFYYIGDWIDEYCDLTLDKIVAQMGDKIVNKITTPKTLEEIREQIDSMNKTGLVFTGRRNLTPEEHNG